MNTSSSLFADLLRELSLAFANDQTVPFCTVHRTGKNRMCGSADVATGHLQELSFPPTFAPRSESSMFYETFASWYFRFLELSFPGTFVPWNFRSRERKWGGTFAPHLELALYAYTLRLIKANEIKKRQHVV